MNIKQDILGEMINTKKGEKLGLSFILLIAFSLEKFKTFVSIADV